MIWVDIDVCRLVGTKSCMSYANRQISSLSYYEKKKKTMIKQQVKYFYFDGTMNNIVAGLAATRMTHII